MKERSVAGSYVLHYVPELRRSNTSAVIGFVAFPPLIGFMLISWIGFPNLGIPAALAVGAAMYIVRRRLATIPVATLSAANGMLRVEGPRSSDEHAIRLEDLLEVSLESKTIQRVQEASGGFPQLRFINSTVAPPVDTARIELKTKDGSIFLSEEHTSYLDANEWFGNIRRFLRRNGWVPEDERKAQQ
jgi:hypothetical protein